MTSRRLTVCNNCTRVIAEVDNVGWLGVTIEVYDRGKTFRYPLDFCDRPACRGVVTETLKTWTEKGN